MTLIETIKETDKMSKQEFQALFFHMLQVANTKYKMSIFLNDFQEKEQKILTEQKRKLGLFSKGTFVMSDDFNEPIDDFKDYM
jgi:hypothetical protein